MNFLRQINFVSFLIIELFSLADIGRSRSFSERDGSVWAQILGGRGRLLLNHCWFDKIRLFLLLHSEDRMILSLFFWVQCKRDTDGRTDGIAVTYTALHTIPRAVKIESLYSV